LNSVLKTERIGKHICMGGSNQFLLGSLSLKTLTVGWGTSTSLTNVCSARQRLGTRNGAFPSLTLVFAN
jgi:hypothetical protein